MLDFTRQVQNLPFFLDDTYLMHDQNLDVGDNDTLLPLEYSITYVKTHSAWNSPLLRHEIQGKKKNKEIILRVEKKNSS